MLSSASAVAGARTSGPILAPPRSAPTPAAVSRTTPTVKPTAMREDALLDLTNRGDIVLDPFLGSGSTLIAAEKTGRICRGVELDSLYVDVIVRRYEATSGEAAVLVETGESFRELAAPRAEDASRSESLEGEPGAQNDEGHHHLALGRA